ncbi:MAG TPA: hypothetical protein VLN49_23425 [Gemmatimonadaceae bacterium]|nr:hypothetical protein [Gemmatimonadaceae bacterium]
MSFKFLTFWGLLGPLSAVVGANPQPPAPTEVRLSIATLHAAALTKARAAGDDTDSPFLLMSIIGPGGSVRESNVPTTGQLTIHLDEALGARPLTDLQLQPGDTVRLLVSLLEGPRTGQSEESKVAASSTKALTQDGDARASLLASALSPVTRAGAHWIGSASMLVTNENGTVYWRALDCIATCKVLKGPAGALEPTGGRPMAGVIELSGDGGDYHLQLQGERGS